MFQLIRVATLVAAACVVAPVSAQTAAEDEARIEELIRREQALRRPADAATAPSSAADAAAPATAAEELPEPAPSPTAPAAASTGAIAEGSASADAPGGAPIAPTIFGDDVMPRDPDEIAIADLSAHLGRAVRVRSHGGRARVGRIDSVDADGLTLTTPMGGGFAKYTLPYSQITRVEKL